MGSDSSGTFTGRINLNSVGMTGNGAGNQGVTALWVPYYYKNTSRSHTLFAKHFLMLCIVC